MKRTSLKLLVFFISFFTLSTAYAQTSILHGSVLNQKEKIIDYAEVLLLSTDSTFIKGTVVNPEGHYTMNVIPGKYFLRIKAMGFKDIFKKINLTSKGLEQTFHMSIDNYMLNEVVVKSDAPVIRREADKIVFDAKRIAPGSRDALDILQNLPGVLVNDGNISALGQGGLKVLINGKDTKMSNQEVLALLKSYQAEQVSKVELMTTPSSKYDAEGGGGIINIKLKKARIDYMSTLLSYSHSYDKYHSKGGNLSFIYNKNRLNFSLAGYGDSYKRRNKETSVKSSGLIDQRNLSNYLSDSKNYGFRGNVEYQINPKASVGALFTYGSNEGNSSRDGESNFYTQASSQLDSLLISNCPSERSGEVYRAGIYSDFQIDSLGKGIHFDLDYIKSNIDYAKVFSSKTYDPKMNDMGRDYGFNNDNNNNSKALTSSLDFNLPFDGFTLNFGAKASFANTKNGLKYYHQTFLDDQMDQFDFTENIYALYVDFKKKLSHKFTLRSGVRLEHTYTLGVDKNFLEDKWVKDKNSESYTRLFPTFYLGYVPNDDHQFNFSVTSRLSRPSFSKVNPFTLYLSKYGTSSGKPDLKPSYSYKANLGYTFKGNLNFDVSYLYESGGVGQVTKLEDDGLTYNTYWENVSSLHLFGVLNTYVYDKIDWMQLFILQGLYYSISKSNSAYTIPQRTSWSYSAMLNSTFFFNKKKTLSGFVRASYSSPNKTAITDVESYYRLNLGARYRLLKNKLNLSLRLDNILSSHIRGEINAKNFKSHFNHTVCYPTVSLSVSYIFGAKLSAKRISRTEIQRRMN